MVDNPLFVAGLAVVTSLLASSGFWAFIQRKDGQKNARSKLLLGLTTEILIYLGETYLDRGWISKEEYDTLMKTLYEPYVELGGNGLAAKIMDEVKTLPIRSKEKND